MNNEFPVKLKSGMRLKMDAGYLGENWYVLFERNGEWLAANLNKQTWVVLTPYMFAQEEGPGKFIALELYDVDKWANPLAPDAPRTLVWKRLDPAAVKELKEAEQVLEQAKAAFIEAGNRLAKAKAALQNNF